MPKLIFVTGGSASGKTTIANQLKESLNDRAVLLSQDMFYKEVGSADENFDVPSAFDWELQEKVFEKLKQNKAVKVPIYCFEKYKRIGYSKIVPKDIIIFEGLFTFWDHKIAKHADFQIFVDTPSDTRLARRIVRDIKERNRDPLKIIERWQNDVQPSFIKYVSTMKKYADIIIPWEQSKDKSIFALLSTIKAL